MTIGFGDPKEKNVLRVSVNDSQELTELSVRWRNRDFSVPASEFKSLPKVQLESIRTQHSGDHPLIFFLGSPYLNVSLRFGDIAFGEYPLAWFIFERGKFRSITFIKRTSESTWDYIEKYPGKEPVAAGVQSMIQDAPSPEPK